MTFAAKIDPEILLFLQSESYAKDSKNLVAQ
jgi:hypothetical protein